MSTDHPMAHLLPDYFAGRLSAQRKAEMEAALAEDAVLKADYESMVAASEDIGRQIESQVVDEVLWARLNKQIDQHSETGRHNPARLWQAVAASLALLFFAQIIWFQVRDVGPARNPALYQSASGAEDAVYTLKVAFAPHVSVQEMGSILEDVEAEIIAGPSAVGLFTLGFRSEEQRAHAVLILRATPQIEEVAD